MSTTVFPFRAAVTLLALGLVPFSVAQTAPASPSAPPTSSSDEVVSLSVFEVSAGKVGRYQADESASGGRIRTNIMDAPTTVNVLTREFIEDIGTLRVLDAAKYIAGIGEATIPNALDRVNIRGFQSDGRRVDGFSTSDQANYDTAGVERMEVIMGPDALLQPAGVPGGTINLVTKRPKFTRSGYITVQAGEYDANRVELDTTGPLGDSRKFAYRFVGAVHDSDGYVQRSYRKSEFINPSFTWRIAGNTQLTIRYEYYNFDSTNAEGVPVDPSVGTHDAFKILAGLPRDFSPALDGDRQFRRVTSHYGSFLLTSTVTDRISVRAAGRISEIDTPDRGFGWGPSANGGARDPRTGLWVGGTVFGGAPNFTAAVAPAMSRTFNHTGTLQGQRLRYRDLQNDWAYTAEFNGIGSQTGAGFAYAFEHQNLQANAQTARPFSVDTFVFDTTQPAQAALNTDRRRQISRTQLYLTEKLEFFQKRVVLSGGVTNLTFNGFFGNKLTNGGLMFEGDGSTNTANYGIVVKPLVNISVYWGRSESAVPTVNFEQVATGAAPRFSVGIQKEYGAKFQLLEKRVMFSVAHYDIDQSGYTLANPANLTSPPPPVLLPPLILTRIARGWEYQLTATPLKGLSLIAGYADTRNRDPNDIPFRSSAEKMWSAYVRYEFTRGHLKGFAAGLGGNWMGKRAGDVATGYAAASTATNPIPNQPSFYLPEQTLVDLNLSYARQNWIYRLNVMNLFDEENYPASGTRTSVYVGNPRNFSGSVTWKF